MSSYLFIDLFRSTGPLWIFPASEHFKEPNDISLDLAELLDQIALVDYTHDEIVLETAVHKIFRMAAAIHVPNDSRNPIGYQARDRVHNGSANLPVLVDTDLDRLRGASMAWLANHKSKLQNLVTRIEMMIGSTAT